MGCIHGFTYSLLSAVPLVIYLTILYGKRKWIFRPRVIRSVPSFIMKITRHMFTVIVVVMNGKF